MDDFVIECIVCNTKYYGNSHEDVCPYCGWNNGCNYEDPGEVNSANLMTREEMYEKFNKGLDRFGDPLPKEKPTEIV